MSFFLLNLSPFCTASLCVFYMDNSSLYIHTLLFLYYSVLKQMDLWSEWGAGVLALKLGESLHFHQVWPWKMSQQARFWAPGRKGARGARQQQSDNEIDCRAPMGEGDFGCTHLTGLMAVIWVWKVLLLSMFILEWMHFSVTFITHNLKLPPVRNNLLLSKYFSLQHNGLCICFCFCPHAGMWLAKKEKAGA